MKNCFVFSFYVLLTFLIVSCGDDNSSGTKTAQSVFVTKNAFDSSAECPNGGVKIDMGFDKNSNNQLESGEIIRSEWVCNGKNGTDGTNGTDGINGTDGKDGKDGANGAAGADGKDGSNAIVNIEDEAAGINCTKGGKKITSGIDSNNNNVLDSSEIDKTEYICNGTNGKDGEDGANGTDGKNGANSIVISTKEEPGENCANGGYKIGTGVDLNGNLQLDAEENPSVVYVCNGKNGADGTNGTNGADGAKGDAGANGKNTVIRTSDEPAGSNCKAGGKKIEYGIDDNGNLVLDGNNVTGEVDGFYYICNESNATYCTVADEIRYLACGGSKAGTQKQICNGSNNTWENSGSCTKTFTCNPKPDSAQWNSVSSYLQTWTGSAWSPADDSATEHNATPSSTSCRYLYCTSPAQFWNGSSCVNGTLYNGLYWSDLSASTMNWDNAVTYCLNMGGRLPTIDELRKTIVNCPATQYGGSCPVTDPNNLSGAGSDICHCSQDGTNYSGLSQNPFAFVWSSSVPPQANIYAWMIRYQDATVAAFGKGSEYSVRCVR